MSGARRGGTNLAVGVWSASRARSPTCPTRRPTSTCRGRRRRFDPGALLGSRLTGRLSEAPLIKAIAVVLLVAAAGCIVQAVT